MLRNKIWSKIIKNSADENDNDAKDNEANDNDGDDGDDDEDDDLGNLRLAFVLSEHSK